jgi:hypothetical protein
MVMSSYIVMFVCRCALASQNAANMGKLMMPSASIPVVRLCVRIADAGFQEVCACCCIIPTSQLGFL